MKKLFSKYNYIFTIAILIFSFTLTSCGYKYNKSYRLAKDGLIYAGESHELFTGTIIDTNSVIVKFAVVNGIKNGRFETYYLNGKVEKIGNIINNKNEGEWKYFYNTGKLESKGNFINDLPNGRWVSYYENGNLKSTGVYANGKMIGLWSFYDIKGKIINHISYKNGFFKDQVFNEV